MKTALTLGVIGMSAATMANTINIINHSNHSIPVKYQLAYHNTGQPIIFKNTQQTIATANSKTPINFSQAGFDHAGVVIVAVKHRQSGSWYKLPDSIRQFDIHPGCWMRTSDNQPTGHISLSYHAGSGKHGRITCRTHINPVS